MKTELSSVKAVCRTKEGMILDLRLPPSIDWSKYPLKEIPKKED